MKPRAKECYAKHIRTICATILHDDLELEEESSRCVLFAKYDGDFLQYQEMLLDIL